MGNQGMDDFEWDQEKAKYNERKHGVDFHEARTVFFDHLARILDDPLHSEGEERLVMMGHSDQGRLLVVVYTERGERMRLISARLATARERK
jgi:uncharacterized DUF497 family protein